MDALPSTAAARHGPAPGVVGLVFLGLALLLATACRHPAVGSYPVGIYSVNSTNEFAAIRAAGFNLITTALTPAQLEAAHAHGLRVLASPGTTAGPRFNAARARAAVAQFDRHPALWSWYLADEPDMHGIDPRAVREAHRFLKNLGATRPTSLVLQNGSSALEYAHLTDVLMIDRYPVPWLPIEHFPQHVRLARLALGPKPPLIAVLQAFDWSAYPKLLRAQPGLRPPTHAELRCMTYGALVRQATGLFYYAYNDGSWNITQHPEVWQALRQVVAEVRALEPLFQAEHVWWPYLHDFGEPRAAFNGALESSVTPALLRVRRGNASVSPGDYVLAVNTTARAHQYRFTAPVAALAEIPVLGENRTRPVVRGWIDDEFAPLAVHVYGPFPASIR